MISNKKQNFLHGSIILVSSTIIVKIIGCFFKIPLQNLIGSVGMGYFSTAYALFNLVYALSVAGLPMAVARMVAESVAKHNYKDVKLILKISTIGFCITGFLGSAFMYFFSSSYVNHFTDNPNAYWCTVLMVPSIFFCCISSAYRGYYEGLQNMYPTAISQLIEAIIKLGVGYFAAWFVIKIGWNQYYHTGIVFGEVVSDRTVENVILKFASAAAIFGVTISTFFGALYIWLVYKFKGDGISLIQLKNAPNAVGNKTITKQLLNIAIPICLAAAVMNIAAFIDTKTMVKRLGVALTIDYDAIISFYHGLIPSNMMIDDIPNFLYGAYSGMSVNIYNLIPSITSSFAISILPAITVAITKNDYVGLKMNMESILRVTNMICMPASISLIVLSKPILMALYGSRPNEAQIAVLPLSMLGVAAIFVSLAMPINSMLQAVGKIKTPAKLMIIGVILKLVINQYLISIPHINIIGAPIGTIVCYLFVILGGFWVLIKTTQVKLKISSIFVKPFIASIICALSAHTAYGFLSRCSNLIRFRHGLVCLLISIFIGVIIYFYSLILLKGIAKDDILMIPGGKNFLKRLEKFNIIG